jgi:hypothetical protein
MLPILGILMLVSYVLDAAALRPPGSIIHLFSTLSCISFVAEFFRSRAVAFWDCRKSSIEMLSLRSSPVNREEARGYPTAPLRMWSQSLDRWWSSNFAGAVNWTVLSQIGFAGIVLLLVSRCISSLAWRQTARVPFGFSGMLLLDASLGLGAFLLAYGGSVARRLRQVREWLQGRW